METQEFVSRKPRKIRSLLSSFLRKKPADNAVPDNSPKENEKESTSNKDVNSPSKPRVSTIRPLSKEDYMLRIDSFSTATWFAKPIELSPLQCARYGWENTEVDTLRCVSCKEVMYAGLPDKWEKETYATACSQALEKLKSAHKSICPWPGSPAPVSFISISTVNMKELMEDFQRRAKELEEYLTKLPEIEFSVLQDQSVESEDVLKSLHKLVASTYSTLEGTEEEVPPEQWSIIALMALFAWQKSSTSSEDLPVVICQYCRRKAGLWNFTPKTESKEDAEEEDDQPPVKRMKEMKQSTFNPASEHRPWCPWIHVNHDVSPDKSPDKLSDEVPWQQLLNDLLKKADPGQYGISSPLTNKITTPPNQAWKAVRRIMSFWQSKETPAKTSARPEVKP